MVYGSIYGAARTSVSEGAFNPDYATPHAALDMVTEGLEIDQKFFDLFVEHDFLEAAASTDVNLESTLIAVDESFIGDVWGKIVEFLKKIRDKIVSIFKAAAVKVGAFFTKDNEALVKKYEKQFNNSDLSMTIKGFRKMKAAPVTLVEGFHPDTTLKGITTESEWKDKDEAATKAELKKLDNIKKEVTVTKLMKDCLEGYAVSGNIDSGKIDYFKALFESPKDVKASEIAGTIRDTLTGYQDAIKQIDDVKKKLDDTIKNMEESAKDRQNMHDKIEGNGPEANNGRQVEQKRAEVARAICTVTNTCVGKLSAATLDAMKFNLKQCRAAYIKIAVKGAPNTKNESVELLEAMIDADEYEVDSFFDQYSYDYEELTA